MSGRGSVDELVHKVHLYRERHPLLRGYVLPFIATYIAWLYWWLTAGHEYYEAGLLGLAAIAFIHILLCLFCHWAVDVLCFIAYNTENNPYRAQFVKVVPVENNGFTELVPLHQTNINDETCVWFMFQKCKYLMNDDKKFQAVEYPVNDLLCSYYRKAISFGLNDEKVVQFTQDKYGKNLLDMQLPAYGELFLERATAPFFVFQIFCVALWCLDRYWYYSLLTLLMLVVFECSLVYQQLRNMKEITKMGSKPYSINVYRFKKWRVMKTTELLPGDIISVLRDNNLVPCDILLLRGSCIVDESMLTGESIPQMKEPLEHVLEDGTPLNLETNGKLHVLFGGTKIIQHLAPDKKLNELQPPDGGCVAFVLRTGFGTSQGKLLRTILFGVKRVTANNLETFGFILFLLIFAIAAAVYVWIKGTEDPERNRYKLFLECALILTTVVPPELPVELSMAVNASLLALARLAVFCTEPFRIPSAGKVLFCCFDKTGTLTSDDLVVEGIAGLDQGGGQITKNIVEASDVPSETASVLATCHSLVQLDEGMVGDPLEKTILEAIKWNLTKGNAVIPRKGKAPGLKIFQRFHFSSALKRMSVVAGFTAPDTLGTEYIACVKGAPEVLKSMFKDLNEEQYNGIYLEFARRGARVLSLGYRRLGRLSSTQLRELNRDDIERDLKFVGFVIVSCPLKTDTKAVIKELLNASHMCVMITGDNALTACHVAKTIKMCRKPKTLIFTCDDDGQWVWQSVDQSVTLPFDKRVNVNELIREHDLCVTGDGFAYLLHNHKQLLTQIVVHIKVFARFAPKQKEEVILALKSLGYYTLMCGDGTNDVGALKKADVGVAILSRPFVMPALSPPPPSSATPANSNLHSPYPASGVASKKSHAEKRNERNLNHRKNHERRVQNVEHDGRNRVNNKHDPHEKLQKIMKEFDDETNLMVKLGDASIAAPFTSKLSSIQCICHIIKHGRCSLVTTLQMFKILALNALILAYSQSVLYLDGIRFSDCQATIQGVLLSACFFFISKAKPMQVLSKQRPLPNIFNLYTVLTVLLQFAVHFVCLVFLVNQAKGEMPSSYHNESEASRIAKTLDRLPDEEIDFDKNILNSAVFIISISLQVSTFAINYRGRPFMEDLWQNKPLLYSIIGSWSIVVFLSSGMLAHGDFFDFFEVVDFPPHFRTVLIGTLTADYLTSYFVDRICLWLLGEGPLEIS